MRMRIGEISKKYGIARSTLYKKVSDGVLTAHRDELGGKVLDMGDIARVFNIDASGRTETPSETHIPSSNSAHLSTVDELRDALNKALNEVEQYKEQARAFRGAYKAAKEKYETMDMLNKTLIKQLETTAQQHDRTLGIFERMLEHKQ